MATPKQIPLYVAGAKGRPFAESEYKCFSNDSYLVIRTMWDKNVSEFSTWQQAVDYVRQDPIYFESPNHQSWMAQHTVVMIFSACTRYAESWGKALAMTRDEVAKKPVPMREKEAVSQMLKIIEANEWVKLDRPIQKSVNWRKDKIELDIYTDFLKRLIPNMEYLPKANTRCWNPLHETFNHIICFYKNCEFFGLRTWGPELMDGKKLGYGYLKALVKYQYPLV